MKCAVLFTGNIRTLEICKKSIFNFFKEFDVDFFVTTYDIKYNYNPAIIEYITEDKYLSENDIIKEYSEINIKSLEIHNNDILKDIFKEERLKFCSSMFHFNEFFFLQYYKFNLGIRLVEKYISKNDIKYDLLFRVRSDVVLKSADNLNFNDINDSIIIGYNDPNYNEGDLLNDQFMVGTFDNMKILSDNIMSEFYDMKFECSSRNEPHGLLKGGIIKSGLKIEKQSLVSHIERVNGHITALP